MTADDLPPDVKRQLLAQVRSQLGHDQYAQLVGSLGEDGVVNLVINQMQNGAAAPRFDQALAKAKSWDSGRLFSGIGLGAAGLATLVRPEFGGLVLLYFFGFVNYWGVLFAPEHDSHPPRLGCMGVFFLVGIGAGALGHSANDGGGLAFFYFFSIPLLGWVGRGLRSLVRWLGSLTS